MTGRNYNIRNIKPGLISKLFKMSNDTYIPSLSSVAENRHEKEKARNERAGKK